MKRVPTRMMTGVFFAALASCATPENPPAPQTPAPAAAPAKPAAAAQPMHLPTAIDLLVGHAGELALRPAQLERVKAIGKKLDETNAPLEQQVAALDAQKPAASDEGSAPSSRPRGGGMSGGGMGGGGMGMGGGGFRGGRRGGMGGGGMGGGGRRGGGAAQSAQARPHDGTDKAGAVRKQMAENHEAAVAEAFALLDEGQQKRAAQLLDENDFDPPSVESVHAAKSEPAKAPDPTAK